MKYNYIVFYSINIKLGGSVMAKLKKDFGKEKAGGFVKDFKVFITRGNMMDMAVGIIIGVAFGAVISSLVADMIMPPVGVALGGTDFKDKHIVLKDGHPGGPYNTTAEANTAGAVTLRWGLFLNTLINFMIIALVVFMMVKVITSMRKKEEAPPPNTRPCPLCDMAISKKATRCPHCTSDVKPEKEEEEPEEDEEEEEEEEET